MTFNSIIDLQGFIYTDNTCDRHAFNSIIDLLTERNSC